MDRRESLGQKKGKMKKLLTEAIALLCRNSLSFGEELTVEGLIGITIDKKDVLLINMNETLHGNEAASWPECQSHNSDTLYSLGYKAASVLESEFLGKAKFHGKGENCAGIASLKRDLQGFDVHSTGTTKDVQVKDESLSSAPAPRRKQRKPVQIKEESETMVLDDVDESDVWESYGKTGTTQSNTEFLTEGRTISKANDGAIDVQEPEYVMLGNDSTLLDKRRETNLEISGNTGQAFPASTMAAPEKSSSRYGNEMSQVVSLKSEGAILSVPSPKSIYNSMRGAAFPQSENNFEYSKPHPSQVYSNERELLSENEVEAECSLGMSGEQVYTGGITEVAELPIDLSMEGTAQQQQHTSTPVPNSGRGYRRRSRFSYSPGKELVNAHGAVRCPVCRKWFDSRIKYNRHKRSHRGIFTCKVCGRAYNRKDNMQRHHKLYHSAYGDPQILPDEDIFTQNSMQPNVECEGEEVEAST